MDLWQGRLLGSNRPSHPQGRSKLLPMYTSPVDVDSFIDYSSSSEEDGSISAGGKTGAHSLKQDTAPYCLVQFYLYYYTERRISVEARVEPEQDYSTLLEEEHSYRPTNRRLPFGRLKQRLSSASSIQRRLHRISARNCLFTF